MTTRAWRRVFRRPVALSPGLHRKAPHSDTFNNMGGVKGHKKQQNPEYSTLVYSIGPDSEAA